MLKNNFKIAYRSLLRHKGYTFINLTGLAIGMACCLLIGLYVQDELSYDHYHKNADRIYRVLHFFHSPEGAAKLTQPAPGEFQVWGNAPVGPALLQDFPEVEQVVQFMSPKSLLLQWKEKRFQEENVVFMDSTVFDLFSWKLLAGNPKTALTSPTGIVLSESVAKKYFGEEDPLGKTITVENEEPFLVTGVMEDIPANSHLQFDILLSTAAYREARPDIFGWWGYVDFYTYFRLADGADIADLEARIPDFLKRQGIVAEKDPYTITFEPMLDAYLHSVAARQPGPTGSLTNVYIFSCIAAFILLIACINFMNLATARSLERAKEVGVRKVIGASRKGLMYQFLTESVLLSVLAALLAFALAVLAMPAVEALSGKVFPSRKLFSTQMLLLMLGITVLVGLLAGSYPAWVLTRFQPARVLKGVFKSSSSGIALRKGLVVFQFCLSMVLIAGTLVVFSQLNHLRSRDLGFQQEQMLIIDYGGDDAVISKIETIKQEMEAHPNALSASASRSVPGDFIPNAGTRVQSQEGNMRFENPLIYEVDVDFIPQYEIEVVAGRAFSRGFPADTAKALILNEAAVQLFGYADPQEIIGKRFAQWGREGTVVGVVKDFNFQSLHTAVEPLSMRLTRRALGKISLQVEAENLQATLQDLEEIWNTFAPHRPFLYSFLDESFNQQYQADVRFGKIFSVFAGMAIIIACLGLFGLATYTAQQRTKEIGIRKVLGASVGSIVRLLSKDFLKLVLIAALIAVPLAWYSMEKWLQDFPYRIEIPLWVFLAAGLLAVFVAFLTISYQAVKAARSKPVKNLRTE